jgi:HSP20 family protein
MIKRIKDKLLHINKDRGLFFVNEEDTSWPEGGMIQNEGELSVDVYEDESHIIIKSTIAGVKPEDIDISIINDLITIRGERKKDKQIEEKDYLYQECYWGSFSRSIILPAEVEPNKIDAHLEDGILTITLKKRQIEKNIKVKIKE